MTAPDRPAAGRAKDVVAWAVIRPNGVPLRYAAQHRAGLLPLTPAEKKSGYRIARVRITEIEQQGGRNDGE